MLRRAFKPSLAALLGRQSFVLSSGTAQGGARDTPAPRHAACRDSVRVMVIQLPREHDKAPLLRVDVVVSESVWFGGLCRSLWV